MDWSLLLQWVMTTTLGWIIGWAIFGELWIGPVIGVTQWLILRRVVSNSAWWMAGTTVGWVVGSIAIGSGLVLAPGPGLFTSLMSGAIAGGLVGVGQWPVLRQWVKLAFLWIPVSAAAWAIAFSGLFGSALAGAAIGAVTGLLLEWLLRNEAFYIDKDEAPHRAKSY